MTRTSNYALRLAASLKAEAEKVAAAEGTTLNQFINVAVAEKLAALRTAQYFKERAARADLNDFDRLLASAAEEPPRPGDVLPQGHRAPQKRKRTKRGKEARSLSQPT